MVLECRKYHLNYFVFMFPLAGLAPVSKDFANCKNRLISSVLLGWVFLFAFLGSNRFIS